MSDTAPAFTIKARRYDFRDEETVDLATFDQVEIKHGHARITIRVRNIENIEFRIIVSGDNALTIYPRASNWIEIAL